MDFMKERYVTREAYCQNYSDKVYDVPEKNNISSNHCQANIDFYSMQYSLAISGLAAITGALFFCLGAIWIVEDKIQAQKPNCLDAENRPLIEDQPDNHS